jgi:Icc-related predicted phosphoesterase
MRLTCISDTHGFYPELPGGDLLIFAGDWTANNTAEDLIRFFVWIAKQDYRKRIVVAGNHDNVAVKNREMLTRNADFEYLCDSDTTFEGFNIYGSPWSKTFEGMNPDCKAFTCDSDHELSEKWNLIDCCTDILVTHSPPHGILDAIKPSNENVGSPSLLNTVRLITPVLHVFGHIHEAYGKYYNKDRRIAFINASFVNEHYKPVNKPVNLIFEPLGPQSPQPRGVWRDC